MRVARLIPNPDSLTRIAIAAAGFACEIALSLSAAFARLR